MVSKGKIDKEYAVAVVGGGAAGLMAALELIRGENAFSPADVVLLEKNDRVGKKILATGNGQCNLSNENVSEKFYHGNKNLIQGFLQNFTKINLIKYFENIGIYSESDAAGRIYPVSRQASAFLDQIRAHILSASPEIMTDFNVSEIKYEQGAFTVSAKNLSVRAENVIFACGGKAGEGFGTDGTAYSLLEKFSHKTGALYPSLVKIKTEREKIKGLKNLKERAKVSVYDGKTELAEFTGDVLFTDYGVSGNAVFSSSAYIGNAEFPSVKIEFLPEFSTEELTSILDAIKNMPFISECGAFVGLINKKIGYAIEKTAKSANPCDLAYAAKNFTLKVEGTAGFSAAQTTKGGFSSAIDNLTYESLNRRGLYIVGEALDVDGDCGGYNLTFAFITGIAAAKAIKHKK